jgi:hypothetical protein
MGLRVWHLLVCLLLAFLLAATTAGPEIQNLPELDRSRVHQ